MAERFTPEDLYKKGYEPDGQGGYRKVRKSAEPEVRDISADLGVKVVGGKVIIKQEEPTDIDLMAGFRDMHMEVFIDQTRAYIKSLPEEAKGAALEDLLEKTNALFLPDGELIRVMYRFNINPCPAPRMTRSDKWKTNPADNDPERRQRKPVTQYFAFRDKFIQLCLDNGFKLDERLRVLFIFPMPDYLSKKKKAMKLMQPHKQRPDADNCAKSILDAFGLDDGYVWDIRAVKLWGNKGQIIIF